MNYVRLPISILMLSGILLCHLTAQKQYGGNPAASIPLSMREALAGHEWLLPAGSRFSHPSGEARPGRGTTGEDSSFRRRGRLSPGADLRVSGSPGGREVLGDSLESWVRHYFSSHSPSDDQPSSVAIDPADGSIYVTGYSDSTWTFKDILTMKYDSSGNLLWKARYNGPAGGEDRGYAVSVDGSSNVYVAGSSQSGTSRDCITIKYSSLGVQQWAVLYNGPDNLDDMAFALAVDHAGNVTVAGISNGSATGSDGIAVRYSTGGAEEWAVRYNGAVGGADGWVAVVLDTAGNAYLTGFSEDAVTHLDYATIKYDPSGHQQWISRYNGPANGFDQANAIALGHSGSLYVTGVSTGLISSYDYATVKYDSGGIHQWVARYDGGANMIDEAYAIAVGDSENISVAGQSTGGSFTYDYATIRYDSSGNERWAVRYDGPLHGNDGAYALAVDGSGNITVTGYSYGSGTSEDFATICYNSSGHEQWVKRYDGPGNGLDEGLAIAQDRSGSIVVAGPSMGGGTKSDYALLRYTAAGDSQWSSRYNGPGVSDDRVYGMLVDHAGDICLTGRSTGAGSNTDIVTVQYDPSGSLRWTARYDGPGHGEDIPAGVVCDAADNIYVAGHSLGDSSGSDFILIKYSPAGAEEWVRRYNGPGNGTDAILGVSVDLVNSVYVTGVSEGSGTGADNLTIKYSPDGDKRWEARYNYPGSDYDEGTTLAVDSSGNVYVLGRSEFSASADDIITIKYDADGNEKWTNRYDGPRHRFDEPSAIALCGAGRVSVTGRSEGTSTGMDYITIQYDTAGAERWASRYNGPANNADAAVALATDDSANVYVTGYSLGSGSAYDYATVKYDTAGLEQWVARWNGPDNASDFPTGLVMGGGGDFYVTGNAYSSGTVAGWGTVKYNSSGQRVWEQTYHSSMNAEDQVSAIALDSKGNIYVAGSSPLGADQWVYTAIRYSEESGFSIFPRLVHFDTLTVSCSSTATFSVVSTGGIDLVIDSVAVDEPSFAINPPSFTVSPGETLRCSIFFAPLTAGEKRGHFTFYRKGDQLPDSVIASGRGTGAGIAEISTITYDAGWQLLSTPLKSLCPVAMPSSYSYEEGYKRGDLITFGTGYWQKRVTPRECFAGFPTAGDTFDLKARWNIIGSISAPVAATAISSDPPNSIDSYFFGYSAAGYENADTLFPGHAYWVKLKQEARLILQPGIRADRGNARLPITEDVARLTFEDARGDIRTLSVTSQSITNPGWYELPPSPPESSFDVRFAGNRSIVSTAGGRIDRWSIIVSAAQYPLKIRWKMSEETARLFLQIGERVMPLNGMGQTLMTNGDVQILLGVGGAAATVKAFSLDQNYPNPFNPTTAISFSVPVKCHVALVVVNVLGQKVTELANEVLVSGVYQRTWNAAVASGVYFYRLTAVSSENPDVRYTDIRKMVVIR